jgi:hypothetical protein
MNYYDLVIGILAAACVVLIGLSFARPYQTLLVALLSSNLELGVPTILDAPIRARAVRRDRWATIGGLIGLMVAWLGFQLVGTTTTQVVTWSCLALAWLGYGIGVALASRVSEFQQVKTTVRLARIRVVSVRDYVSPALQVLAWTNWGIALAIIVSAALSMRSPDESQARAALIPAAIIVAAVGVSLVLFEFVSRSIVGRAQPAGSTDELMWDDALRSRALRDILTAPLRSVPFAALAVRDAGLGRGTDSGWLTAEIVGVFFAFLAFAIVFRGTRTRYFDRLWSGARRGTPEESAARDAADPVAARNTSPASAAADEVTR